MPYDIILHVEAEARLAPSVPSAPGRDVTPLSGSPRTMSPHMGMFEVKGQVSQFMGVLRALVRIQGLSPLDDLTTCGTRSSSHTVAACCGGTNIPHPAGVAQEAGTILSVGC